MKKEILKKLLILLIVCTLLGSSLVGCKKDKESKDEDQDTELTQIEKTEEPTEAPTPEPTSTGPTQEEIDQMQVDFDQYAETLAKDYIESSPLNATFIYGDLESIGLEHLLYEIDDASLEASVALIEDAKTVLKELKEFQRDLLTTEQQNTYDMLIFQYQGAVDSEPFMYFDNVFQPNQGVQIDFPIALMQIELESELEVQAYLERLKKLPAFYDQIYVYERERAKIGNLLPESMYDLVIEQIDSMVGEPKEFMLYQSFCDRVDALAELDDAKRVTYKETCLDIIKSELFPAFEEMKEVLAEIKVLSTNTMGLPEWENGKAYYDLVVESETSEFKNTEELRTWANGQLQIIGMKLGTIVNKYPEISTAASTGDIMSLVNDVTTKEDMLTFQEDFLASEFLDYGVVRASENIIPTYLEEQLPPAFYFPVSVDLQDYGNMYMASDAYDEMSISTAETDIHENVPGHHLYFSVLYGSDLPLVRKVFDFDGFTEGWAQYVQGKTYERAASKPEYAEFWRWLLPYNYTAFILLDIEVNYDGISKEAAINKLMTEFGYPEEDAESSYNRMIANPGELIHYYHGVYKMNSYLDDCMKELGDQFDIKAYHDMILMHGGLPFTVMDEVVEEFIENGGK